MSDRDFVLPPFPRRPPEQSGPSRMFWTRHDAQRQALLERFPSAAQGLPIEKLRCTCATCDKERAEAIDAAIRWTPKAVWQWMQCQACGRIRAVEGASTSTICECRENRWAPLLEQEQRMARGGLVSDTTQQSLDIRFRAENNLPLRVDDVIRKFKMLRDEPGVLEPLLPVPDPVRYRLSCQECSAFFDAVIQLGTVLVVTCPRCGFMVMVQIRADKDGNKEIVPIGRPRVGQPIETARNEPPRPSQAELERIFGSAKAEKKEVQSTAEPTRPLRVERQFE